MSDEKEKSIGALWQKESKNGIYYSGTIEIEGKKIPIVAFKNSYKQEDKHPDFKIFIKKENPKQNSSNPDGPPF